MSAEDSTASKLLLNQSHHQPDFVPAQPVISSFGNSAVTALGMLRAVTGFSAMLAPTLVGKLFYVPVAHPQAAWLLRLFGVRDMIIGDLTYFSRPKSAELSSTTLAGIEKRNLRNVLLANIAVDGLDIVCTSWALYQGTVTRAGYVGVGGGALLFLLMGVAGLRSMS